MEKEWAAIPWGNIREQRKIKTDNKIAREREREKKTKKKNNNKKQNKTKQNNNRKKPPKGNKVH